MARGILLVLVACLVLSLGVVGCGPKKEASSTEAIQKSDMMQTVQEKTDYLVGQANAFLRSEQFQDAIDVAQYVLNVLDKDSKAAQELITKATEQLKAKASEAMEDIKGSLGTFGK